MVDIDCFESVPVLKIRSLVLGLYQSFDFSFIIKTDYCSRHPGLVPCYRRLVPILCAQQAVNQLLFEEHIGLKKEDILIKVFAGKPQGKNIVGGGIAVRLNIGDIHPTESKTHLLDNLFFKMSNDDNRFANAGVREVSQGIDQYRLSVHGDETFGAHVREWTQTITCASG